VIISNQKEMNMFKHVLLPTDGSDLSAEAIKVGILFAKSIRAKVTGLCVMPLHYKFLYGAALPTEVLGQSTKQCKELAEAYLATIEKGAEIAKELAEAYLSMIEKSAEMAGVACDVVYERNDSPYEAIISVAEQRGCDLIMMASHGRRGVGALLIGSETQKVLTHSKIPVLVYR
jgi:nucleotide-binding universal stress UspA family protein